MARCASSRANSAWRRAISARAATTPSEDGTTMLKIFGQARSRTFRVLWLCEESSIPYEHIPVSIKSDDAQCKEPWYLALTPNGRVPTIDDDGTRPFGFSARYHGSLHCASSDLMLT